MDKAIITVAPTGSFPTSQNTPHLPVTPEEIAEETYRAYQAGAAVVHLHARDPKTGAPTPDVATFREIVQRVRAKCDIIVQITSGGGAVTAGVDPDRRLLPVTEIKPEMASLNAGSMNFGERLFVNTPDIIQLFARRMREVDVKPEFECFDCGQINNVKTWVIDKEILAPPLHYSFVLGVQGGMPPSAKNLLHMTEMVPAGCTCQVVGLGRHEMPLTMVALYTGGNARVGFEDNLYLSKGVLARSNAELVEKVVGYARDAGRDIASVAEARDILSLCVKPTETA